MAADPNLTPYTDQINGFFLSPFFFPMYSLPFLIIISHPAIYQQNGYIPQDVYSVCTGSLTSQPLPTLSFFLTLPSLQSLPSLPFPLGLVNFKTNPSSQTLQGCPWVNAILMCLEDSCLSKSDVSYGCMSI